MSKPKDIPSSRITDEQIVDLYFDRDENAIPATETKYGNMLFGVAYNILHDSLDCEECKNDTYLAAWNAIPPSRPVKFPAFLSRIMHNIATDRYRERISKKRIPSELTVSIEELQDILLSTNNPEMEYEAKEIGKIISEYIRGLAQRQRYIFFARFCLAKTVEQIAKEYGISSATVHREINKIKQGLKVHLERNGVQL